jgi:general secretion pathway protein E
LQKYNVIPISQDDMNITIAFNDPLDIEAQESIQRLFPRKLLKIALATNISAGAIIFHHISVG